MRQTPNVRVAILDDYQHVALGMADWPRLPAGVTLTVFDDTLTDTQALAQRLRDFEIIVSMRERTLLPGALLEQLPSLRLIAATGRRQSNIDVSAATRLGIHIATTDSPGVSTSELTWGLIFAVTRRIPQEDAAMRAGRWQTTLGVGLEGKALGLVGVGRIGASVAKAAPAFGVSLIAWTPNLTPERAGQHGARAVSKEELFSRSDIVSLHVPGNEATRGLVGERELALMRPSAYLVNTSRGPVVDEAALVKALRERRIAGAALDVFDVEPLPPGHPLTALDNVVLAPHLGYVTEENYRIFYGQCLENIEAYLAGAPARLLNPDAARVRR